MALIAWTKIKSAKDGNPIVIQAGEEVTAEKLGLTSKQFDELILSRAVRDKEFPIPANYPYSVRQYYLHQIKLAGDDQQSQLELVLAMSRDTAPKPAPMAIPDGLEPGTEPSPDATAPAEPELRLPGAPFKG